MKNFDYLMHWDLDEHGKVVALYIRSPSEWVNPIDILELVRFCILALEFRLYHFEQASETIQQQFDTTIDAFRFDEGGEVKSPVRMYCEDTKHYPVFRDLPNDNYTADDFEYERIYSHMEFGIIFGLDILYNYEIEEGSTEEDIQDWHQSFHDNMKRCLEDWQRIVTECEFELTRQKFRLDTTKPIDWKLDSDLKIIFRWNDFGWVYSNTKLPPIADLVEIIQGFIDISERPEFLGSYLGYKRDWLEAVKQLTHDPKTLYDICEHRNEDSAPLQMLIPRLNSRYHWYKAHEVMVEINTKHLMETHATVDLVENEGIWSLMLFYLPTREVIADKLPYYRADGETYLRFIDGYLKIRGLAK